MSTTYSQMVGKNFHIEGERERKTQRDRDREEKE